MTEVEGWAWVCSIITIVVLFLTMRKVWYAPILGVLSEIPWIIFAFKVNAKPLLVCCLVFAIIYTSNIKKWYEERLKSS